ncbi:MAG: hypothetical protein H6569_06775 [Lewinellaceae bacterium]|nr:hypothetical protein [Lewinellaceae bacterium]
MPARFDITATLFPIPGTAAPDVAAVQAAVESGLSNFWPALGLPTEPQVGVRLSTEPADLFDIALELGGRQVPVPVIHTNQQHDDLPYRILASIFSNRASLISSEQLRGLRAQCLAIQKPAMPWNTAPEADWRAIAELLLQNGFSLTRLAACFENWTPGQTVNAAFEELIGELEMLRLRVVVHPAIEKLESRFPDFYQEVYESLGVILPKIVLETDETLAPGHFRLQLNDLILPVQPAPENNPDPEADCMNWLDSWVRQCAGWFVNTNLLEAQLDSFEESNRALIVMIREQWPTHQLCAILRQLLSERVNIRNLTEVLDVLLRIDGPVAVDDSLYLPYFPPVSRVVVMPPGAVTATANVQQLAGQVRANLKYPVVYPLLKGGVMPCYTFDPGVLRDFREGFFGTEIPRPGSTFYQLLRHIFDLTAVDLQRPVFLVPSGLRHTVQAALQPYFPSIEIIGHEEMPAFFVPSVKATVTLP